MLVTLLVEVLLLLLGVAADVRISVPLSYRMLNKSAAEMHSRYRARRLADMAPMQGDLALGYYYTHIWLGSSQQRASVILDTGSSLTALPCVGCSTCGSHSNPPYDPALSNSSSPVLCSDALCPTLDAMVCVRDRCGYSQHYSENSALTGHYVRDKLWFSSGSVWNAAESWGGISYDFGCHESETNLFRTQSADGIMGLSGRGKTLIKALVAGGVISANVLALCMAKQGGVLSVGGYDSKHHLNPPTWTSLVQISGHYCVQLTSVSVGNVSVGSVSEYTSGHGCVLDSGTTYTYLPSGSFHGVVDQIRQACADCVVADNVPTEEHTCFTIPSGASPDLVFPSLTLQMERMTTLPVSPSRYLTQYRRLYCISIYDNGPTGSVIGANFLQTNDMIIDLDAKKVGFAPSTCTYTPSPTALGDSRAPSLPVVEAPTPRAAPTSDVRASHNTNRTSVQSSLPIALAGTLLAIGGVVLLASLCCWLWKRRVGGFHVLNTADAAEMAALVPAPQLEGSNGSDEKPPTPTDQAQPAPPEGTVRILVQPE